MTIERKLGNDELKAFFKLMHIRWDVLSWHMDDMHWEHGRGETFQQWHPVYHTDVVKPSKHQAYVLIDYTHPVDYKKEYICEFLGLHQSKVFEKFTSNAYGDGRYGMAFTFTSEVEDKILAILAEANPNGNRS